MADFGSKKQSILVISAAVGVIFLSVMVTLLFSGNLVEGIGGRAKKGYQNITFTDAVLTCQQRAKDQFNKTLKTLELDNHSSRYDEREFRYKIFMKAHVSTSADKGHTLFYVNCFVKSSNGRVSKYESWEDKGESVTPVTERPINAFGWPK